jgi:hypothetical protein
MIESIREQIDAERQARDNEKTEEDIADKQRKLAYLQQDTSGANALDILQLQKEIDEAQESYTDTLIDQRIEDLEKQNDQAAEQRERQIEIMQNQLKLYEESGWVWRDVKKLIDESVEGGVVKENSPLMKLLKDVNNFEGMSNLKKMDWLHTLETTVA